MTKYRTYREDVQLAGNFEKYTKDHYDSWVTFARETGHGNDIKPILVAGVDMTKDFAMMSYSNNDDRLTSEFTTSVPGVGSVWGTWRASGSVYTNCGPHLSGPPSPTPTVDLTSPGTDHAETTPDEYNQCVFVRYYTVRKRLGIPRVIKIGAGPESRASLPTPLIEKRLPIRVDGNGGLSIQPAGYTKAHTLISRIDQRQCRSSDGYADR